MINVFGQNLSIAQCSILIGASFRRARSKESSTYDEDDLRTKFTQPGQKIGGTTLGEVKEIIKQVKSDMDNELRYYRWKLPLIMILFVGILSVVSVIVTYINGILTA